MINFVYQICSAMSATPTRDGPCAQGLKAGLAPQWCIAHRVSQWPARRGPCVGALTRGSLEIQRNSAGDASARLLELWCDPSPKGGLREQNLTFASARAARHITTRPPRRQQGLQSPRRAVPPAIGTCDSVECMGPLGY